MRWNTGRQTQHQVRETHRDTPERARERGEGNETQEREHRNRKGTQDTRTHTNTERDTVDRHTTGT